MSISTTDIKTLREATGAGVLDCKKALESSNGNVDEAKEYLRKKGLDAASKKNSRQAKDGLVSANISADGKTGVLLEVNCETDFVARTEDFKSFTHTLLQQVASQPNLTTAEALLAAPYLNDSSKVVSEQLTEMIAKLGENMVIRRVARFSLEGDGLLGSYIHLGSRVGVLLEVTGNPSDKSKFAKAVHDVALQIVAASAEYVSREEIPADVVESKNAIYHDQIAKWYAEVVLLEQPFVKDSGLSIAKLLENYSKELGTELKIARFARFELGVN